MPWYDFGDVPFKLMVVSFFFDNSHQKLVMMTLLPSMLPTLLQAISSSIFCFCQRSRARIAGISPG